MKGNKMIKYEVNFDIIASAFLAATRQNVIEGKMKKGSYLLASFF